MRVLGPIVRLQIQRAPLKRMVAGERIYDPTPIVAVDRLALGPEGAFGLASGGGWIVDVHHRAHPDTRNPDGQHALLLGFTGHYGAMKDRFGPTVAFGCGGENILVDTPGRFTLADFEPGIAVLGGDGTELLRFAVPAVARPCRPFSAWLAGAPVDPESVEANLAFLDAGTRGFRLAGEARGLVALGDQVAIL